MKLISVDNCDENNIITMDKNFTASLDANCMVQTAGCIKSKGFKEAKVRICHIFTYLSKLIPVWFNNHISLCLLIVEIYHHEKWEWASKRPSWHL